MSVVRSVGIDWVGTQKVGCLFQCCVVGRGRFFIAN